MSVRCNLLTFSFKFQFYSHFFKCSLDYALYRYHVLHVQFIPVIQISFFFKDGCWVSMYMYTVHTGSVSLSLSLSVSLSFSLSLLSLSLSFSLSLSLCLYVCLSLSLIHVNIYVPFPLYHFDGPAPFWWPCPFSQSKKYKSLLNYIFRLNQILGTFIVPGLSEINGM